MIETMDDVKSIFEATNTWANPRPVFREDLPRKICYPALHLEMPPV